MLNILNYILNSKDIFNSVKSGDNLNHVKNCPQPIQVPEGNVCIWYLSIPSCLTHWWGEVEGVEVKVVLLVSVCPVFRQFNILQYFWEISSQQEVAPTLVEVS